MPKFLITSPDGRKFEVTGPDGATPEQALQQVQAQQAKPAQSTAPSGSYDTMDTAGKTAVGVGKEAVRQVGRLGADVAEGAAALPLTLLNVPNDIYNLGAAIYEKITGKPAARMQNLNAMLANAVESPEIAPRDATERVVSDVNKAIAGVGTGMGAGQALATGGRVAQGVGQQLLARPGMQIASAASGAAAGGSVREAGGGPVAQIAASVAGGMAPYALYEGGKAVARGARAMVEPFTEGGRKQVVGRALSDVATDPQRAQQNMANASEIVPGSRPTAAQVSEDYGIISTERAAKATNPAAFAERASDQNAARQGYLEIAAKDRPALDAAIARRDAVTKPLREQAFQAAAGKSVDSKRVVDQIDTLLANPDNAGSKTQQALQWARDQIADKTDPRALYAVRKEIADAISGKIESDKSFLRYTGGELRQVRGFIDDAIQEIAPTWKQYLTKYTQLSKPIDRMTQLQGAQSAAALAAPDVRTGYEFLSQAKWKTQVKGLLESGVLTKGQQARVQRIADDLARGAAINDPAIRAIGSNTTQDMTAANLLGQMIGSTKMAPFVRSLARPLQWIYKVPEKELQDLLSEALLDPKLGAELMENASGAQMGKVSALLRQRFLASSVGTGEAVATQRARERKDTAEARQ